MPSAKRTAVRLFWNEMRHQRTVLVLRDVHGVPAREASAQLGIGLPAVKSHLHRGRLAVRGQPA